MKQTSTLILLLIATASHFCCMAEAQVSCNLCDDSLSAVAPVVTQPRRPVRNMAQKVRQRPGKIVPTWDRLGRFNRDAAYRFNEDRPLSGLFAPDFELTASVFGGWNRIVGFGPDSEGDDIFDDDFAVGIAYGRRHSRRLRSEFEFVYRSNESGSEIFGFAIPEPLAGEVQVFSIMKNFLIDIETPSSIIKPYVGIGIGYANVDVDFNRNSLVRLENSSSFAWQPIGGTSIQLTERAHYYVEYRYFSTTDLELTQNGVMQDNSTYNAHNLFMGLRMEF